MKSGHDAQAIYLMGDIFDYWFEYKKVVPRGFVGFPRKMRRNHRQRDPCHVILPETMMYGFSTICQTKPVLPFIRKPAKRDSTAKNSTLPMATVWVLPNGHISC